MISCPQTVRRHAAGSGDTTGAGPSRNSSAPLPLAGLSVGEPGGTRMPTRHGHGHQARRNALRAEMAAAAMDRADSTDPRCWPAPHWTHNMATEAVAANDRRWATAQHGEYIPPPREPVTEAWTELEAQREAETRHRLDLDRAREQMRRAEDQAALGVRSRRGASCAWPRRDPSVPPQEWGDTRAAARAAARAARISPPKPGATRPLGPGRFCSSP